MADQNTSLQTTDQENWRPRVYAMGGLIGAAIGLLSAFLYIQAADEQHAGKPPETPSTGDSIRLGVSLLSIIRTITEWGSR